MNEAINYYLKFYDFFFVDAYKTQKPRILEDFYSKRGHILPGTG